MCLHRVGFAVGYDPVGQSCAGMWARAECLPSAMTFTPVDSEPVRLLAPIRDPVLALSWQSHGWARRQPVRDREGSVARL